MKNFAFWPTQFLWALYDSQNRHRLTP